MEEDIGYTLFDRRTREVSITPAGAAFVSEARQALDHVHKALENGAAANRKVSVLSVGYTPLLDTAILPKIRARYATLTGGELHFESAYSTSQLESILNGRLEAGLLVLPVPEQNLDVNQLFSDRLIAAVRDNSPFARASMLPLEQLDGKPIIWSGRATNQYLYEDFVRQCRNVGFTPHLVHEVFTITEILDCVAGGFGIGLVPESVEARLREKGVSYRPLAFRLAISTGVASRRGPQSNELRVFINAVRHVFGQRDLAR